MTFWIGTSGWQYADWRGTFYPREISQKAWLAHYAKRFRTVELNNSFYRLPSREQFETWAQGTPDDFCFAVKASRFLTHMKKLKDPHEPVERFLRAVTGLGGKLGPVLVQLPGNFKAAPERLAAALDELGAGVRVAVELRHASWFSDEVREVLTSRGAALCLTDRNAEWATPTWRTADWTFMRFHWGTSNPQPCYAPQTLAARLRVLAGQWDVGDDVFVFFNNDPRCCAVRDADLFARACSRLGVPHTRAPDPSDYHLVRDG